MPSSSIDQVQEILREYQELGNYHGLSWDEYSENCMASVYEEIDSKVQSCQKDEPSDMTKFFMRTD